MEKLGQELSDHSDHGSRYEASGDIPTFQKDYLSDNDDDGSDDGIRRRRFLDDLDDVFEQVSSNDLKLTILGEIVSAQGFEASNVCVHYLFELPKGWRNDCVASNLQGITNSCYSTVDSIYHFSFSFFTQLVFSLDLIDNEEAISRPIILIMVASMLDSTRVKFEGYGYITIPTRPGSYLMNIQTWKPKPRTIEEQLADCFVDVTPSLQDIRAVHIPYFEGEECRRANRLGLQTEPSGYVKIRLSVARQTGTTGSQSHKLLLMEKMSSLTIVKSVQTVIEAFQRARKRAENAKLAHDPKYV